MLSTHPITPETRPSWDNDRTRTALSAARCLAARHARGRQMGRADREDLTQDILLTMVEAGTRYDAERGSWSTFVSLVGRRVIIDRARVPRPPVMVPLTADTPSSVTVDIALEEADPHFGIGLREVAAGLPARPRALLHLVAAHGDVVDARRTSGQPVSSFYRSLGDLRWWLRASGLRPDAAPRSSGRVEIHAPPTRKQETAGSKRWR